MASSSNSPQPKPGPVAVMIGIVIVIMLIAAVVGISFLSQPYFAIGQVVIYAGLVAVIAGKLRTCLRLAQGSEYHQKVKVVVFWVVLGVFSVVVHLGDLFESENRDYITLATNVAVYLALLYALELVDLLLKRAIPGTRSSAPTPNTTEATTAPNQPFLQTGGA
jgi:uncharacterized membrane protein HdeD (DUF308 family)